MSSVFIPFWDIAAARLIAVVVLPTPPFWFVMEMITGEQYSRQPVLGPRFELSQPPGREATAAAQVLHPVLAEVLGVDFLQPLLEALGVRVALGPEGLALLEDFF